MTDPTADQTADQTADPSAASGPTGQPAPTDPWRDRARWERVGDIGSLVWGVILVAVGGWFFVEQTLGYDLPSVDWGVVWPIVLIAIGGWVVLRAMGRRSA
jgi:hypothetical protein